MSSYTSLKRVNFVNQMAFGPGVAVGTNSPRGTSLNFTAWLPLAADPEVLTDAVGNAVGELERNGCVWVVVVTRAMPDHPDGRAIQPLLEAHAVELGDRS